MFHARWMHVPRGSAWAAVVNYRTGEEPLSAQRTALLTPNITFDRTAGSRSLAAAGQRARSAHRDRRKAPRPPLSIPTAKRQEDHRCYELH